MWSPFAPADKPKPSKPLNLKPYPIVIWRTATMPTTLQIHKLSSKTQTSNVVDMTNCSCCPLVSVLVHPLSKTSLKFLSLQSAPQNHHYFMLLNEIRHRGCVLRLNTWNSKLLLNLVSKTETQQNLAILLRGRKPQGLRSSIAHDDCHRENKMLGTVSSFNRTPWSESTEVSSLTSADYIYTTKLVVLQ